MSFYYNQIAPDKLPPSRSHGIIDVQQQDYEAEVERLADGSIEVIEIEPGFHEGVEDDIRDAAEAIFAACPSKPGRYLCDATYTFRYSGNHTADAAENFREVQQ